MNTSKLIIFNILAFITSIFTLKLHFGAGFTGGWSSALIMPILTITLLFLVTLLTSLSYIVTRALHKKNLLRISILVLIILSLASIIARILEAVRASVCRICIVQTLLYLVLLGLNIFILKDLHILIEDMFKS